MTAKPEPRCSRGRVRNDTAFCIEKEADISLCLVVFNGSLFSYRLPFLYSTIPGTSLCWGGGWSPPPLKGVAYICFQHGIWFRAFNCI